MSSEYRAFDASELKLAKYIVTGLTVTLLGISSCGIYGFESDVRVAKSKAAVPGYTGCDHHCGNASLEIEQQK